MKIRKLLLAAPIALPFVLGGCPQFTQAVTTVCNDIATAQANQLVAGSLNAQDPHSALGVLWADAKSACVNGVPAPMVATDWGALVWGEVKTLAPVVVPILIGML